jgi:dipeptidyl aminopeptidase/acylaminoacyl peptidase
MGKFAPKTKLLAMPWWMAAAVVALALAAAVTARAQEAKVVADAKTDEVAARSKSGKKLFGTAEALRIARAGTPRISPDGMRVAYLVTQMKIEKDKDDAWKNVTQLWVAPTAGPASAARQFTRGEKSVGNIAWSPDGKILAFTMDAGEKENAKPQVWFMYADGGEPWQVTKHKSGVSTFGFSPDGKTLLLTATFPEADAEEKRAKQKDDAIVVEHDLKYEHLWTWDVATGAEKQVTKGEFTVSDARWSPDGRRVTYTEGPTPLADDSSIQTVWVMEVASGEKRKLVDMTEETDSARWSADGKWIAFVGSAEPEAGKHDLYVVSAEGGTARKLTGSFDLSVITPHWAPDGRAIYFSATNHEAGDVFAADVAAGGSVRQMTKGTGAFELSDVSKTGNTVVGVWSDPTHPEYAVSTDLNFQSMTPLSDLNGWLAEYELANEEVVKWKSSKDGWEIEGVVVKPVDFDASRKWPFLLHPHGGPTGATVLAFDPTSQIMAANGYLQLEPNFRGSTGRGEKFSTANENDWGNGDYKDDMSGVQAMVDKGWADPDRMGAFGWSYGGYMTFWIDTQTDKFKAISPGAGLPDLYSMYSQSDIHRYMRLFFNGKAPWDNFEEYWEHSPMKYVNNVKTPTMILHGQGDTRVPNPQGEEFYRALVERHVPVEYVVYPRENHGFNEGRHQQDRWQRYLVFFGKYLNQPPVTEPKEVVERMSLDLPQ